MDAINTFLNNITNYSIISIIGLAKNVSKTTTLNYLIKNLKEKLILGLTSIGRDGEKYDIITQLPKPRILIEKGTYVATAKESFENSKIPMELIKNTGINTPLGEVLILKTLERGLIELAGPSTNTDLLEICLELRNQGCEMVLIDGAFDRRSYATPIISEATILSTGASVSEDMNKVIDLTVHSAKLLTIEVEKDTEILKLAKKTIENVNVAIINKDHSIRKLNILTALDASREITDSLDKNSHYLVIKGALTDKLLYELMKFSNKYKGITILVEDATKLFLGNNTFQKFLKKGGFIKVLNPVNIIAITINPTSPMGYAFNKEKFLNQLKKKINIPVYDLGPSG